MPVKKGDRMYLEGYIIVNKHGKSKPKSLYGNGFFVFDSRELAEWDINNERQKVVKVEIIISKKQKLNQ